jgi:hypothetical protein
VIRGCSSLLMLCTIGVPLLLPSSVQAGFVKFVDETFTGADGAGVDILQDGTQACWAFADWEPYHRYRSAMAGCG